MSDKFYTQIRLEKAIKKLEELGYVLEPNVIIEYTNEHRPEPFLYQFMCGGKNIAYYQPNFRSLTVLQNPREYLLPIKGTITLRLGRNIEMVEKVYEYLMTKDLRKCKIYENGTYLGRVVMNFDGTFDVYSQFGVLPSETTEKARKYIEKYNGIKGYELDV